jgi:HD-GYP domain-containing protein (c-di-GMP phosphodiesterase class II)
VAIKRSGRWFDPELVEALGRFRADREFWDFLDVADIVALEPPDRLLDADESRMDRIAHGFARIIDAKSPWTHRHSERACTIATGIGSLLGFDGTSVRDLARAARLHDIGKLAISNRILDKPGRLDDVEFAQVKAHPLVSQRILERVPGFSELAPLAGAHHERLDGTGYPRGLMADELTMPMRVLAVADVYEALTAERPYRSTYTAAQAFAIMRREVPRRLDPDAFAALEALLAAGLDRARQGDRHHASGAGVSELA